MKTFFTSISMFVVLATTAFTVNAQDCIDSSKINGESMCPMVYAPVCGCNNITYSNSCVAQNSGVLSFTEGECQMKQTENAIPFPKCEPMVDGQDYSNDMFIQNNVGYFNIYLPSDECNSQTLWYNISNDTIYFTATSTLMYCGDGVCKSNLTFKIPNLFLDSYVISSDYAIGKQISVQKPVEDSVQLQTNWKFAGNQLVISHDFMGDLCNVYNLGYSISNDTIYTFIGSTKMACLEDGQKIHNLILTIDSLPFDKYYVDGILNGWVINDTVNYEPQKINSCYISYSYINNNLAITWPYANTDGCNSNWVSTDIKENTIQFYGLISSLRYCFYQPEKYEWDYITTTYENVDYSQFVITGEGCQDTINIEDYQKVEIEKITVLADRHSVSVRFNRAITSSSIDIYDFKLSKVIANLKADGEFTIVEAYVSEDDNSVLMIVTEEEIDSTDIVELEIIGKSLTFEGNTELVQRTAESTDIPTLQNEISISPNPTTSQIEVKSSKQVLEYVIINSVGVVVATGNDSTILVDKLPAGVYSITCTFIDKSQAKSTFIKK